MARFRVMTWKGIPAQVRVDDETGTRVNRELPAWFAQEIDRVAMRDGLVGTDEYVGLWSWSKPETREGAADEVVTAVIRELCDAWGQPPED